MSVWGNNKNIGPLSENCYYCHGPDENTREAKLRLDDFDSAIEKEWNRRHCTQPPRRQ